MADPRLLRRLDQVGTRLRTLRGLWTATIGWSVLAVAVALLNAGGQTSLAWSAVLFGIPCTLLAAVIASARRASDRQTAAVLIEQTFPQLDSRLLTAVQQQPRGHDWDFSFLQSELLTEVFAQLRRQDWHKAVAGSRLWVAQGVHAAAAIACLLLLLPMLRNIQSPTAVQAAASSTSSSPPGAAWNVTVEPGDAELERGTSLLVLARFPERIPANVELVAVDNQAAEIRLSLQKSLDDPLFGGRIAVVDRDLTYHVEFDGQKSPEFNVTTFDYPALLQADADITYPAYTQLAAKTVNDIRRVTLVEGSTLHLACQLNKEVQSAVLVDEDAKSIELESDPANGRLKLARWTFETPGEQRFKLHLRDEAGRANRDPTEFRITVVPNRAPDLKVAFPTRDLRVSALQELLLNAQASDDFGLQGLGLIYQTPDGEEASIDFAKTAPADETVSAEHLLAMEQIQVQPDDLLSYYFYADDIGPDGQARRSFSDIYFAEVRPFEEIFRQVPPSPRGEGDGECQKLLKLQRQVVAAAWNVIRREKPDSLSEKFSNDVSTLVQSQSQIRELVEALQARLPDALLKQYAAEAIEQMQAAIQSFKQAVDTGSLSAVTSGRTSAQAAYQSLLKLQSRETFLKQCQGESCRTGEPENKMNQQLQALKLKNDRDRYETERQAKSKQTAAAQAALEILHKLKELARRQEDLNNRVRELESALREASTTEEKQEIERQLQRLRKEQEELLRNLDEAREQMNQEPVRQQMQEARKQADEARERVVQSSEALKEGQTSRALTAGTRAERQLHNLEEQLRQQTAGQFDDALRELRANVRQLAEKEQTLGEQLKQSGEQGGQTRPRRSLKELPPENSEESLAGEFQEQKDKLHELLERARHLVEQAEVSEPLLSKKLYETLRDLRKHQPEEALETVIQFTQRGIRGRMTEEVEQQAQQGIQELQLGIEAAASSILGNEEAALQQAQAELKQLTEAIRRELALNDMDAGAPEESEKTPAEQNPPAGGKKPSQAAESQKQSASSRPDQKPGQQKEGQQKQGQQRKSGQTPGSTSSPGSNSPSQGKGKQQQQSGQQPAEQQAGQGSHLGNNAGQSQQRQGQAGQQQQSASDRLNQLLGLDGSHDSAGTGPSMGPLTGSTFLEWSNRLQNVEEMLTTPELRAQAAAIRDRARLERVNVKRHSKAPDWELVRTSIYGPLVELEVQIATELARRDPQQHLVPVDRDPVPERYTEFVKSYYEQLSRQRGNE